MKYARMSNYNYGYSPCEGIHYLITGEAGEMLKEKAVETGYLPDELDVDPEDLVTHYQAKLKAIS